MTVQKPLWLLDIDGVINSPLRKLPTDVWPEDQWLIKEVWALQGKWPIHMAIPVRDLIVHVHEAGLAEIRWHTTWQQAANNVSDAFDLPHFPIQDAPEAAWYRQREWWKLPTVFRELLKTNGSRRILWTDNDIDSELSPEQKATLKAGGCTLLCPNSGTGFNSQDLQALTEFLTTTVGAATVPETHAK